MNHLTKLAVGIATLATAIVTAIPAQAECFLKLDGIKGDSADGRHLGEIAVTSWSWGLTQTSSSHIGSGGGAGAADIADLKLTKNIDHATPLITKFAYMGSPVKSAVLSCRARGKSSDFLIISLSGTVFISSHKYGIDQERPTEELTLHFSAATITHYNINADGAAVEPVVATLKVST
jgi:type VI secretion system secreted protein Hcp